MKLLAPLLLFLLLPMDASAGCLGRFRVEVGVRQANLYTKMHLLNPSAEFTFSDNNAFLTPFLKLAVPLNFTRSMHALPFVGFGEIGGDMANDAYEPIRLLNLEIGSFVLLQGGPFSLGPGIRFDYSFDKRGVPEDTYKNVSLTGGIRLGYLVQDRIPLGAEAWYTLTDLNDVKELVDPEGRITAHSLTYGLFIGYVF
jgi:hypothetical protein